MKFLPAVTLLLSLSVASPAWAATFDGYPCLTPGCSDHRAGYAWAKKKNITNPDDCNGNSESFVEGCRAWADGGPGRIDRDNGPEGYE